MKISELEIGTLAYTQLSSTVLAVLSRRVDGWCVYVGAVPGEDHTVEWTGVAAYGEKQKPEIAEAIVKNLFYPPFEPDLPYSH